MMAASLMLFWVSTLYLLLVSVPHVTGMAARGQCSDLQVQEVSRVLVVGEEGGEEKFEVTVTFASSIQPQVRWFYRYIVQKIVNISDTHMTFSDGHGQSRATFSTEIREVTLWIGHWESQHLRITIQNGQPYNVSQTLNTRMSCAVPGNDISYNSGESFQVEVIVPKHIGNGFTWSRFLDSASRDYNVYLYACYVDQSSGEVFSSVDVTPDPDMSQFLQSAKTFSDSEARWQLNFTTAVEDISGFFRLENSYYHNTYLQSGVSKFVTRIYEMLEIRVHNADTPGPFPRHYAYVGRWVKSRGCWKGRGCGFYCNGYANNITQATIFKEDTGEVMDQIGVVYDSSAHVTFHTHFPATGNFTGNYVCRITTADGTTAQNTVRVYLKQHY